MPNLVTLRPRPGDVVERVYRVECELGSDASCAVLGAVVPATGKRYALRCWLDSRGADAAVTTQQFVRLANALALFEQPGIVEVYGVGRTNGLFFSVTEWLEGTTLERFLERSGPLAVREALALLLPCLEGLAAAHSGGISHGDLRPANVFVCRPTRTEPERARLGKFECGRWPDKTPDFRRQPSVDLYQRQFVSPEELQGAVPDLRSDVYAIGVMLYVTLTGRPPFSADSVRELDGEISAGAWQPLSEALPQLSPGLDGLITRALALDPDDRFQDMSELLAELARVEGHANNALAKHAPVTSYKWITPASTWLESSLFDVQPSAFDEVEARRSAGASRVLRACLVLALGLLCVTLVHRMVIQPEVPLLSAQERQRMLARPVADDEAAFASFSPLLVPAQLTQQTSNAVQGQKAAPSATAIKSEVGKAAAQPAPAREREAPRKPALAASESTQAQGKTQEPLAPLPRPPAPSVPLTPSRVLPAPTNSSQITRSSAAPLSSRHVEALDQMQLQ